MLGEQRNQGHLKDPEIELLSVLALKKKGAFSLGLLLGIFTLLLTLDEFTEFLEHFIHYQIGKIKTESPLETLNCATL